VSHELRRLLRMGSVFVRQAGIWCFELGSRRRNSHGTRKAIKTVHFDQSALLVGFVRESTKARH
jgi:hypothetical protein